MRGCGRKKDGHWWHLKDGRFGSVVCIHRLVPTHHAGEVLDLPNIRFDSDQHYMVLVFQSRASDCYTIRNVDKTKGTRL